MRNGAKPANPPYHKTYLPELEFAAAGLLNAAVNVAATDKTILERFSALGFETAPASPEALAQRSKAETAKWAKAIRDAKIEPQ